MKGKLKKFAAVAALSCMLFSQALTVYASETGTFSTGDNFTQLFHTKGFMGNAEVLTKLNWVAGLVSAVISICGFIGVSLTVIRLMISLLYKSNPVLFDEIDEIKKSNTWSGGEGAKGMIGGSVKFLFGGSINGIKEKSGGGIIDTIIWFFLGAMPNVKHYSDFNEGGDEKLKDLSTTQYILKISPKIIMQVFFFSIAWNGVLFQAYGSVVDAMGVVAQRWVNDDLVVAVENALDTGKKYSFTFKNNGTKFGEFQQTVANNMYSKACKKMSKSTRSQEQYYEVGVAIDSMVNELTEENVVQVGSARSGKVNLNQNFEKTLASSTTWEKASTTKIKGTVGSEVCTFTTGKDKKQTTYTVKKITDESGAVVGYVASGGAKPRYIAASNASESAGDAGALQASSAVYGHLSCESYTTSQSPVTDAELNEWKQVDGRLQYVTELTSVGANSGVSWVISSETTPYLYLVSNIYYTDSATAGTNYFERVAGNSSTGNNGAVTKNADSGGTTGPDDGAQ